MFIFNRQQLLDFTGLQLLLDQKRAQFKCRQFVKPLAKLLAFVLAGILINLVSNRVSNIEQSGHVSDIMILFVSVPLSFFHYKLLSIITLIVCCVGQWVGNQIFMEWKNTEEIVTPSDPQIIGPSPPQDGIPSPPQDGVPSPPQERTPSHLQNVGPCLGKPCPQVTGSAHSLVGGESHCIAISEAQPLVVTQSTNAQLGVASRSPAIGPRDPSTQHVEASNPQVIQPPITQLVEVMQPQVRQSPSTQLVEASHIQAGSPDLGILDYDLQTFFYHLKQHYQLPAPTMSATSCIRSIGYTQTSSGTLMLTVHITEVDMTNLELQFNPVLHLPTGSTVFYRPFAMGPDTGLLEMENFRKMVLESMKQARVLDSECTLQFGSFAVLKYTESGLKWWRLEHHWIPTVTAFRLCPWNLLDAFSGSKRKWIIKGFNLERAIFKASTVHEIEIMKVCRHQKTESGEDVLLFEEPQIAQNAAPMLWKKVYVCASKSVQVLEGDIFNVQSEPIDVKRAYWIFVMEALRPSWEIVVMVLGLSVLRGLSHGPREMHVGLTRTAAEIPVGLAHDDVKSIADMNFNISILLHTLSEVYKFCLLYIIIVGIPIFTSTLGQLCVQQIGQLGYYRLGWRAPPLKGETSIPSCSSTPLAEDNISESSLGDSTEANPAHAEKDLSEITRETGVSPIPRTASASIQEENYRETWVSFDGEADSVSGAKHGADSEDLYKRSEPFDNLKESELSADGALQDPSSDGASGSGQTSTEADSLDFLDWDTGNGQNRGRVNPSKSQGEVSTVKDFDIPLSPPPVPLPPLPSLAPLPPNWKVATTVATGCIFYYNDKTLQISWERPETETSVPNHDITEESSSTEPGLAAGSYSVPSDSTNSIGDKSPEKETVNAEEHEKGKFVPDHSDSISDTRESDRESDQEHDNDLEKMNVPRFHHGHAHKGKKIQERSIEFKPAVDPAWKRRLRLMFRTKDPVVQLDGLPPRLSYRQLSDATRNFADSNLVGRGGFRSVYRGVLPSGIQVAVAKAHIQKENVLDEYFQREVSILSQLRHRNVVRLLAWCENKGQRYLVYEFVPNGTLSDALFPDPFVGAPLLSWRQRFSILTGIAAALEYLHLGCKSQVIHRDVKSWNVLLDEEWNAKLTHFDFAFLIDHQLGMAKDTVMGTVGYMAPEIMLTCQYSTQSDVFAFGVVVLEVVCGRQAIDRNDLQNQLLVKRVWSRTRCGHDLMTVVDERLREYDAHWVEVSLKVGLLCTQDDPESRPSMRQVVQILAGDVPVPALPMTSQARGVSSPFSSKKHTWSDSESDLESDLESHPYTDPGMTVSDP